MTLNVNNGQELSGVMDSTLVLTPDKLWLVNNNFKVDKNGHLILKPGTRLINKNGIINFGSITGLGTADSLIVIDGPGGFNDPNLAAYGTFSYTIFQNQYTVSKGGNSNNPGFGFGTGSFLKCQFKNISIATSAPLFTSNLLTLKDNVVQQNVIGHLFNPYCNFKVESNNFFELQLTYNQYVPIGNFITFNYNNFWNIDFLPSYGIKTLFYCHDNLVNMQKNNSFVGFNNDKCIFLAGHTSGYLNIPYQYWGTSDKNKVKLMNYDFWDDPILCQFTYNPILTAPSDSAHGIVWKVLVNGKDAQDEYEQLDPLGVRKQKFEIYFNRAMDTKYPPTVSMGVRYPYSQTAISEDGSWSADSTIYTVYKNIGLTTGDGINTIRVVGAKDPDHFEIPIEDRRFRVIVNAANSASVDFIATPGLGKVQMEWNNSALNDGLGFNMYRMEQIDANTLSTPVMINQILISDTVYTDFAVTPNKKYFYYYKILRTNLAETDSSKVVSATPFTASKGDANGDLSVNVLDVTTIVAYLLNATPQPFIYEAADYNSDGNVNVLDIVGVVNLILNGSPKSAALNQNLQVHLYMKNDTLFADAPVAIGGIQFDLGGTSSIDEVQKLAALDGFESGYCQTDKGIRLLYFSMSGKTLAAGQNIPLLKLKKGSGITEAIFGDKSGTPIAADFLISATDPILKNPKNVVAELGQNYPNPMNRLTTIPVRIFEPVEEAVIKIFNVEGQLLKTYRLANPIVGEHLLKWDAQGNKGLMVCMMGVRQGSKKIVCPARKMIVQ